MADLYGTLSPELALEQQRLNRQQKMAEMLLAQGSQPQAAGQMVSGRYVPNSFFQNLQGPVNMMLGAYMSNRGDKAALDLAQKLRQEQEQIGSEFFQNIQGKPAVYGPDIPTETYETVKGEMISPATGPDYAKALKIASNPNAPAFARNYMNELLKPRTMKPDETFQVPTLTNGQITFNQMGAGGMVLPSDLKSIAIRLGLPTDSSKWTDEQRKLVDTTAKAEKGPPVTNLTVNTGKAYTGAFGEGIAKEDLGKYSIAEKAPSIYQNAINTEDLLNKGAITGLGADFKLNLARALNVVGANNNEIIKNTEQLVANRGQIVLDSIKASGLGAGQGFTDKDRQFLEKVKGGTIELNSNTLRELARIEKSVAQSAIDSWNKRLPNIPKEALQGTGVGRIELQQNQWRVK